MFGGSIPVSRRGVNSVSGTALASFRARFPGVVLLPGEDSYETARRVWNGRVDKRPTAILFCTGTGSVVEALALARDSGLEIAVRGGGHNPAGTSVSEGGLVIDLSRMKRVEIDPETERARAEPGLLLGEFDAATAGHGLATTMGVNSDTGIAGLSLGGGMGRLARKHGLACDNLLAAEMVLADGRVVTASAAENADLYWAIRGGGGNFGIVTSFTYRLHRLQSPVLGGLLLHELSSAPAALRFYRDFAAAARDEVSADAILLTAPEGRKLLAISVCYAGPVKEGERVLGALRAFGPPVADLVAPVFYPALQRSADPLFARGRRYYWKAQFLDELSDAAIDALTEGYARATSPHALIVLQQVGGVISRVPVDATAYAHRDAAFDCVPVAVWEDPAEDKRHMAWARTCFEMLRPFSSGGVYVNTLGDEGEGRVRAAYGPNYQRLAALKAKYDPDNLFRLNQNIRPSG